jgi:hypothetical protein
MLPYRAASTIDIVHVQVPFVWGRRSKKMEMWRSKGLKRVTAMTGAESISSLGKHQPFLPRIGLRKV